MRRLLSITIGVLVLGLLLVPVQAQVTTGTLLGRVLDPSGLGVPGAEISVVNEATSITRSTVTDDEGNFTLSFLPVGRYTLTVSMPGFKSLTETGLAISSGQKLARNLTLEVGTPDQSITVESAAPLLNSVNAEQDITLGQDQVANLPVSRRDFTQILALGTGTSGGGDFMSMNGLPPRGMTFTVDGVDSSSDVEFAGSMSMYQNFNYIKGVSMDAIQEVEISKNIFSAEIGQTVSGNVNIITKSGTNRFHGSLFEYYQSGGLMAVNHFGPRGTEGQPGYQSGKEPQVFHQFGGTVGGPIVKDKLFFFGNYEGYRLTGSTVASGNVPSRWIRNELSGLPGADTYYATYPLPTGPEQPGDQAASYAGIHPLSREDDHWSIRGDYNLTDTDFITGRVTVMNPYRLNPRLQIGNPRTQDGSTKNYSLAYTRAFSPVVTSEFRFGYNDVKVDRLDGVYATLIPALCVDATPCDTGELLQKWGHTMSFENTWSWNRGEHAIKFGGLLKMHYGSRFNEESPEYGFDTVEAAKANLADEANFQFELRDFEIRNQFFGFFVQDDWRVRPDFVLNLGLRWDYSGVADERDGRYYNREVKSFNPTAADALGPWMDPDSVWEPNYMDFSPRVSFAWTLDESQKTVLRAGYGIFYIPFNLFAGPVEIVKNGLNDPVEANFSSADAMAALGIRYPDWNSDVFPKVSGTGIEGDSKIDPHWDSSYSQQWTLGIQRELTKDMVLDVAYVGNHGTKLIYSPEINRPIIQFNGPVFIDYVGAEPPVPAGNNFRQYMTADSSVYHSMQTSLKKRFSQDFSFNTAYTWASNIGHFQTDFTCCGAGEMPQDIFDLASNRGPTPFHIRHRFTTDFLWEMPWLRDADNAVVRSVLGGWGVSGVVAAQSGSTIFVSQGNTRTAGGRPDFVGSSHSAAIFGNWSSSQDGQVVNGNNCSDHCYWYLVQPAFALAPTTVITDSLGNNYTVHARPGTMGRRSLYGPGEWTVDLALSKSFAVTEGSKISFRADFFNFFNKTNLGNPRSSLTSSRFGQITGADSGRVVQFSLRFDF